MEIAPELRRQVIAAQRIVTGGPQWVRDAHARPEDFPVGSAVAVTYHRQDRVGIVTGTSRTRVRVALTTPTAVEDAHRIARRMAQLDPEGYAESCQVQARLNHQHFRRTAGSTALPDDPVRARIRAAQIAEAQQFLAEHPDEDRYVAAVGLQARQEADELRARTWEEWVHVVTRSVPFAQAARPLRPPPG